MITNMFNKVTPTQEQEFIQWARDNFHQKVGVSGPIRAIWHPIVRKEMWRLKKSQMETFKTANALRKKQP